MCLFISIKPCYHSFDSANNSVFLLQYAIFLLFEGELMENIKEKLISIDDNFDQIWETGNISAQKQIIDLFNQKNHSIFTVSHQMTRNTPKHKHDFYEIMYVYNGTILNVTEKKKIYMSSGDFCIMNLSSSHSLTVVDREAIVVNICISSECISEGILKSFYLSDNEVSNFLKENSDDDFLYIPRKFNSNVNELISEIIFNSNTTDNIQSLRLAGNILFLLAELANGESYSYHGINEDTRDIMNYIMKHFDDVTLEILAKKFNYNKSYLSRFIKQNVGKSLTSIVTEARMYNAKQLLIDTDFSIQTISDMIGYNSYSHFHKTFKKMFDVTPHEYRHAYKQD